MTHGRKKRKELLAKRKYFSEHPEEVKEEIYKRFDGIGMIPVEMKINEKYNASKFNVVSGKRASNRLMHEEC